MFLNSLQSYLNMEGMTFFLKIFSQCKRRKQDEIQILRSASGKLIALKKELNSELLSPWFMYGLKSVRPSFETRPANALCITPLNWLWKEFQLNSTQNEAINLEETKIKVIRNIPQNLVLSLWLPFILFQNKSIQQKVYTVNIWMQDLNAMTS